MNKTHNLLLFTPNNKTILQLQKEQQSYYFSAAFATILTKHGMIGIKEQRGLGKLRGSGFVTRGNPISAELLNFPLLFEGPVHPSVLSIFGVEFNSTSTDLLYLSTPDLETTEKIGYSQFTVRNRKKLRQKSEPYPFICEDILWNKKNFSYQTYQQDENWQPILFARSKIGEELVPVGITNGFHIILGIPLFDLLVFQHTFPPLKDAGYYRMTQSFFTYRLEKWLIELAIKNFNKNNIPLILARNWPKEYKSAFSIRHDFDRPITDEVIDDLISFYAFHNLKSTWFWLKKRGIIKSIWFWLKKRAIKKQIIKVTSKQHEVALHTEAASEVAFKDELSYLQSILGKSVQGITAHGGRGSIGYIGMKQHEWCKQECLLYGEMLGKNNVLPHSSVTIESGIPKSFPLVLPVVHNSLDRGMNPEDHYYDKLKQTLPDLLKLGSHCILMNHPDIHIPQLKQLVTELPLEDTWKETFENIAQWIRIFKLMSQVEYKEESIIINFSSPLPERSMVDVVTESYLTTYTIPKGARVVEIYPQNNKIMVLESKLPIENYFDDIRDLINLTYQKSGLPLESAIPTIKHNTEVLSRRTQNILEIVEINNESLIGELGCGFGFLALGIHKLSGAKVIGFDRNPRFLQLGYDLLERNHELKESLSFQEFNYLTEELPANTFDLLTLYGTFHFIVGNQNKKQVLSNIYQALKPGGQVFFNEPNSWYPKEAFTKMWFVHWLPRKIGDWITTRQGKRTLLDLDYRSPWQLQKLLQNAGFKDIRYYPCLSKRLSKFSLLSYLFCSYYSMTARKP